MGRIRLLPLALVLAGTGCNVLLPLGSPPGEADATVDSVAPLIDVPRLADLRAPDAPLPFTPPKLDCQPVGVVGSGYPTSGLASPCLSLDDSALYAFRYTISAPLYRSTRDGVGPGGFGPWALPPDVALAEPMKGKPMKDHTWLEHNGTPYLIGAYDTTDTDHRRLALCKPDKSPCEDVTLLDSKGQQLVGDTYGINDVDGPSVGLVEGKLTMVLNGSSANTPGTEQVFIARLVDPADPSEWQAIPADGLPQGADDPGLSRDGALVVYTLKKLDGSNGGVWASYREPGTTRFTTPQPLAGFDSIEAFSPEVRRPGDGTLEIFVFAGNPTDPVLEQQPRVYRSLCAEIWP